MQVGIGRAVAASREKRNFQISSCSSLVFTRVCSYTRAVGVNAFSPNS